MGHAGEGAVILRGCGAAVLSTGGTPGCEKPLALKASFIVFFLVAEHPIIYKTLKAVVLNVLAYEPDFFFFPMGVQAPVKQTYYLLMCLKDVLEPPSLLPLGTVDSQFESYQLQEFLMSLKGLNSSSFKYLHPYVLGLSKSSRSSAKGGQG